MQKHTFRNDCWRHQIWYFSPIVLFFSSSCGENAPLSEMSLFGLELRHGGPASGLNYSITESIWTYIFMRQVHYKGELFLAPWKKLCPFQHPEWGDLTTQLSYLLEISQLTNCTLIKTGSRGMSPNHRHHLYYYPWLSTLPYEILKKNPSLFLPGEQKYHL